MVSESPSNTRLIKHLWWAPGLVLHRRALVLRGVTEGTWSIDQNAWKIFPCLIRLRFCPGDPVAFQFPKYVVLLSINTIVQGLLKYEIPWLFLNLCRYRKINQIELCFATATFYTYTAEVKSTLFCGYILFSYSFKCTQTNLYERYFKCICTYSVSNKHLFCIDIYINTLHGHNGFHILTKKHQRGNKYQRQHVEETSPIQNKQNTPKHYSFSICTRPAVYNGTVYFFYIP